MARDRHLRPEEARLWRVVAGTVTPMEGRRLPDKAAAVAHEAPAAASGAVAPAEKPASTATKLAAASGGQVATPPEPVPDASGHKRVRRGRVEVGARIDLHGMTRAEAERALGAFIPAMRANGLGCVLVITGKGLDVEPEDYMAPQPGVIRRRLPDWLNSAALRPHITGHAPAHARHGGSGASYVFLKKPAQ